MKNIGITIICMTPMNDCICLIADRHRQAEAGDREREQQLEAQHAEDQSEAVWHVHGPRDREHDQTLNGRDGGAAKAFADHDRAAPDRRNHHLPQEPEFTVPDDRRG